MYRERAAGMYSELPFALAQCLIELPYNLAQTMVFCCTSYFMLGFDHTAGGRPPCAAVIPLCACCCCRYLIPAFKNPSGPAQVFY